MESRRIVAAMRPHPAPAAPFDHVCCIHPPANAQPAGHGFSPAEVAMLRQRGLTPDAAAARLKGGR